MGWNNFPENWEKDIKTIKILPEDTIPKKLVIGNKYHLSWASNKAMVWILKSYNSTHAFLETPRTKKKLSSKITDLRELNKQSLTNANLRIKNYERQKTRI